jgi:Flp pilus assembly protein TadG
MQLTRFLLPKHLREQDRGAVLVLFAITAVMLFGFAAIAVDSAHAFVERRDSQATADVAAIGGAITLIDNTGNDTDRATDLTSEAMSIAARNLGPSLDWAGCIDADKPSQFTVSAADVLSGSLATDCISWSDDWTEVRVRIPTRAVDTFFAGVIGFDTININAFAEVGAVIQGAGGVLPLGVLSDGTNGLVCVKTGPQFPADCEANETGNFDFLDFYMFGNTLMGTTTQCSGSAVTRLKENISHGVDHDLAIAPSSPSDHSGISGDPTIPKEDVECPSKLKEIEAIKTETGNKQKVIIDGFVKGSGGYDGRLTLGNPTATADFQGTPIDDVGLWAYFNDTARGNATAVPPVTAVCPIAAYPNTEDGAVDCVVDHGDQVIFREDIQFSARLAKVPELWQTAWPSGTKYVSFQSFSFVYIQTLYGGCKNNGTCSLEWRPGESKKLSGSDPVAVTAIAIPDSAVPQSVRDSFGTPTILTYALTR